MMVRRISLVAMAASFLCACGQIGPARTAKVDYAAMSSVSQVERIVPSDLRIAYQNLFSCTFDLAAKERRPAPSMDPSFAGAILDAVRKDPLAGDKCMAKLRYVSSMEGSPAPRG